MYSHTLVLHLILTTFIVTMLYNYKYVLYHVIGHSHTSIAVITIFNLGLTFCIVNHGHLNRKYCKFSNFPKLIL